MPNVRCTVQIQISDHLLRSLGQIIIGTEGGPMAASFFARLCDRVWIEEVSEAAPNEDLGDGEALRGEGLGSTRTNVSMCEG